MNQQYLANPQNLFVASIPLVTFPVDRGPRISFEKERNKLIPLEEKR
jgi:hypothetical protein